MLRPVSWRVSICDDSFVLLSGSLAIIFFDTLTGTIVVVACLFRCVFAPESEIANMLLLG